MTENPSQAGFLPVPRPPTLIGLDFDGVIMDSMGLKLDSYCYAFAGEGFAREDVRRLQLASAGLSRFKTIPFMYQSLTGKPMSAEAAARAVDRFREHDEASREKMRLMAGAREFLEAARACGIPMIIVTGTPQEVIERTLEHFSLRGFFAQVHGSPGSKPEHLTRLAKEAGADPARCLYVGDAIMDQEAAQSAGMAFAGVDNGDHPFRAEGLSVEVRGLGELIPFLQLPE
ncbi:MAG: HAD family hydrolase [Fibrobacteres bacterium]|nr:HAD family hydrolase [Fibrobacterota bacterium]